MFTSRLGERGTERFLGRTGGYTGKPGVFGIKTRRPGSTYIYLSTCSFTHPMFALNSVNWARQAGHRGGTIYDQLPGQTYDP